MLTIWAADGMVTVLTGEITGIWSSIVGATPLWDGLEPGEGYFNGAGRGVSGDVSLDPLPHEVSLIRGRPVEGLLLDVEVSRVAGLAVRPLHASGGLRQDLADCASARRVELPVTIPPSPRPSRGCCRQ